MDLKESKEQLPISFLTDFVSRGWDQVGQLKETIASIKDTFSGTKKVEEILQPLVDAYLVCIGQLELHMQNKDYIEMPEAATADQSKLKESVADETAKPAAANGDKTIVESKKTDKTDLTEDDKAEKELTDLHKKLEDLLAKQDANNKDFKTAEQAGDIEKMAQLTDEASKINADLGELTKKLKELHDDAVKPVAAATAVAESVEPKAAEDEQIADAPKIETTQTGLNEAFNCDFDEPSPSAEPLTDADLYPDNAPQKAD